MRLLLLLIPFFLAAQEWEVSVEENESVTISIEGNISAGDKHRIVLVPFTHEQPRRKVVVKPVISCLFNIQN